MSEWQKWQILSGFWIVSVEELERLSHFIFETIRRMNDTDLNRLRSQPSQKKTFSFNCKIPLPRLASPYVTTLGTSQLTHNDKAVGSPAFPRSAPVCVADVKVRTGEHTISSKSKTENKTNFANTMECETFHHLHIILFRVWSPSSDKPSTRGWRQWILHDIYSH